jgi:hypothetical protein
VRLLASEASESFLRLRYLETLLVLQPAVLSELRDRVWPRCAERIPGGKRWRCDHADHGAQKELRSWARRWGLPRWSLSIARRALDSWARYPHVLTQCPPPWFAHRKGAANPAEGWSRPELWPELSATITAFVALRATGEPGFNQDAAAGGVSAGRQVTGRRDARSRALRQPAPPLEIRGPGPNANRSTRWWRWCCGL